MRFKDIQKNANFPETKMFFLIFIPLLLLYSSITTIFLLQELKSQKLLIKTKEQQNIEMMRRIANDDVKSVISDLFYLSVHPVLHQMVQNENPVTQLNLSGIFKEFSKNTKLYDQVRFLDQTGMERVRVNFDQGHPYIVDDDKLQDKAKRYYFSDSFKLEPGRVFISPFDLNIEHGQIQQPLKPMIRFGTPVVDFNGQKRGVVLLNYFGAKLIDKLKRSLSEPIGSLMLLNSKGYWLKGLKKDDEWGFMYKDRKNRTLALRYPECWETISSQEEGQFVIDEGIYTFATIRPLNRNMQSSTGSEDAFKPSEAVLSGTDFYWKIISLVSKETLNNRRTAILYSWLPFYGMAILILAMVSWGLSLASTNRKKAVEERLEREKLQGVVEMAGAICHEINQPLMSISGYSELLLMDLTKENSQYRHLKEINEQAGRLGQKTGKLMRITQYKTKKNLKGSIIDIDKASSEKSDTPIS